MTPSSVLSSIAVEVHRTEKAVVLALEYAAVLSAIQCKKKLPHCEKRSDEAIYIAILQKQ